MFFNYFKIISLSSIQSPPLKGIKNIMAKQNGADGES
ncbi:hypothetical protein BAZSYMB_SCAFFOLD00001_14 [Bathymodiolus azoricus thioautotrophic gill symbiont]|uniref:Uncharacterized protein n=1 Tax=Bathymodiolus azoricus thioautotrophic gill symbiont TaxID=235205 RepID=A0A1H6KR34_9GAMM|nr:hypothetical protein BAZSYMB_SCAFFOLD00001_14 [Bathymodiolus azoricus thioautotrophic gill symbiont]